MNTQRSNRGRGHSPALSLSGIVRAMPRRPKAYSYVRFSSPEQAKGDSLRRQTEAAERYAAANDLDLDRTLTLRDLGVSAYTGRNTREGSALRAFLDAIENGKVPKGSVLLVESLDRLSRQRPMAALMQLNGIIEAGVDVVTLFDSRRHNRDSLNSPELFGALAVMMRAHEESATKSQRVKASWAARRKKYGSDAVVPGQKAPFYIDVDRETRKQSVDAKLGRIAREIALAYIAGDPLREIVRDLNSRGLKSPQGAAWSRVQLTRTLRALANRDGPSPIDRGEKARLRNALKRRRSEGRPRKDGGVSILRGLGRCAYCGNPLMYSQVPKSLGDGKSKLYEYLRCTTNAEYPGRCEGPAHIRYEPIAQAVVELALGVADNPPPVSRKLAKAFREAQAEADRLFQKAQAMTETWEAEPSRETAGRVREAWLEAQRANDAAETALAVARPGFSPVDGEALKAAASDAAMNTALRAFLSSVDVRHEANAGLEGAGRGVITFHYHGGGTAAVKYEAAPRKRADAGKPKQRKH